MPIEITMPRLSDTMEAGTVIKWNVAEGDTVSSGDVVADVETDKATMELSVFDDGTIARILVDEGQLVDVGTTIAVMAEEGEDRASVAEGVGNGAPAASSSDEAKDETKDDEATDAGATPDVVERAAPKTSDGGRMKISPVARRMADEHDLDLRSIQGSGPSGRIIKRDVLQAIGAAEETAASRAPSAREAPVRERTETLPATRVPTAAAAPPADGAGALALMAGRKPLTGMRQTIAKRLVEAKQSIPHYQVTVVFDMDPLLDLRKTLNEQLAPQNVKLSVNDFLVRACALAMYEHPDFNASFDGDAIVVHPRINIGMAISVGEEKGGGLVVGVVSDADQRSLRSISAESKRLAEKARTRGLTIEEMSGATFTLSNLGMFGVEHFTAIINPPNSAILAVGAALQKPVVRDGELTVGHEMSATLSLDHRVIDGAMAAQYLQTLKRTIENPATLLV